MAAKAAKAAGGGLKLRRGKPGAALTITGTPVLVGQDGVTYTGFVVSAHGGRAPYTYSIHAGSLPTGITLNSVTGVVSGTPSGTGSFSGIVIRVTDTVSATADLAAFTLVISAAAAGFNGGRSQINFNFLQTGGEFPFINHLKTAQSWLFVDNDIGCTPNYLSTDGYPNNAALYTNHGGVKTRFFIPDSQKSDTWVCSWVGTGSFNCTGFGSTQSGTNGHVTFIPGNKDISFQIVAGTNLTDVKVYKLSDETALNAGEIFRPDFIAKLNTANCGVLRFLNWQHSVAPWLAHWADRKPSSYWSYQADEMKAGLYAGTSGGSANAYTCSAPSGWTGLVDKASVIVTWHATGSSNTPTLSVGGTAAKTIIDPYTFGPLNPYWPSPTECPTINRTSFLIYDQDLDKWIKYGGDHVMFDRGLENGVPYEICIALCNKVSAYPWFIMPMYACDPVTDFPTQLATYCRDNGFAGMIPRFEVQPNECWNDAGGFFGTPYGEAKASVHWGTPDINNWVGKVASTNGQAILAVYGSLGNGYQTIVGVQTAALNSPNARLNSALYVSQNGGSPAYNYVTHICITNYFGPSYTVVQQNQAATDYAAAAGNPTLQASIVQAYMDSCLVDQVGSVFLNLPRVKSLATSWKAWAAGFGVNGITCYEGGYGIDYTGVANLDALKSAGKRYSGLQSITTQNYNDLLSVGVEFPSCFELGGADADQSGTWTVCDPDIYAADSPSWLAIAAFNA